MIQSQQPSATVTDFMVDGLPRSLCQGLAQSSRFSVKLMDAHGRILSMNRASAAAIGVSETDCIGRYWPELWPVDVRPQVGAALSDALAGNVVHFSVTSHVEDRAITWNVELIPLQDAQGRVDRLMSIRQAQPELSGEYLDSHMRHDLLNVLTVVNSGLRLLSLRAREPEVRELVASISEGVRSNMQRLGALFRSQG